MLISTLDSANQPFTVIGLVYHTVGGDHSEAIERCVAELEKKARSMNAHAVLGLRFAQVSHPGASRTALVGTAVRWTDASR